MVTAERPRTKKTTPPAEAAPYSASNTTQAKGTSLAAGRLEQVALDRIQASPHNPRTTFDEAALRELADSIVANGLLQPIVVRPIGDDLRLIAGERRWRAAQLAGLASLPAIVRDDLDDVGALTLTITENLQRRDLTPIEEAHGFAQLNRVAGMKQAAIASAVNRSQPYVANLLRLLDLPEEVQARIQDGQLTASHGVALARYKAFPAVATVLADLAIKEHWPVSTLEQKTVVDDYRIPSDVVRRFSAYIPPSFVATSCQACPFDAFRSAKNDYGNHVCLKPDHFAELQVVEGERNRQRIAEARAQAIAAAQPGATAGTAPTVLVLSETPYSAFRYRDSTAPPGCSADCPCAATAIGVNGAETTICADPKRFEALRQAEFSRQAAATKAEQARLETALDATLTPNEADTDSQAVAVLIVAAIRAVRPEVLAEAAARRLPGIDLKLKQHDYDPDKRFTPATIAALAKREHGEVIRFAIDALGTEAIRADYRTTPGVAAWLKTIAAKTPA